MRLPGGDCPIIDARKILEYCLSADHEDGRHKARLFNSILGINAGNAELLLEEIRRAAAFGDAVEGKRDIHGQRFIVDWLAQGPKGESRIRTVWIIATGEISPRMVTCYIILGE